MRRSPAVRATSVRLLVAVGMAGAVTLFFAVAPVDRHWFDLSVYFGAIGHWVHDGGGIYDYLRPGTHRHYGFTYPPFAAVCMLPMALVDWPSAVVISGLLNAAAAAVLLYWLADPVARRQGWSRWFAFVAAACLFAMLEPVRDSFGFGQVNLVLMVLVLADAWLLGGGRGRFAGVGGRVAGADLGGRYAGVGGRFAGVGIGLATAIKLTPAIFIGYLAITRRWRAAGVAAGVAAAATLLGALVAPDASRVFWTEALWDTDRVGSLAYTSNQSWPGVLARLAEPADPGRVAWALGVLALVCVWAFRARRAAASGDEWAGFALTGLTACLISPVTWVHHLVWLVPSLAVLADAALRTDPVCRARRRRLLVGAVAAYVGLCSSIVWLWRFDPGGVDGFLGGNAYAWLSLALLLTLPVRSEAEGRESGGGRPGIRGLKSPRTGGPEVGIPKPKRVRWGRANGINRTVNEFLT